MHKSSPPAPLAAGPRNGTNTKETEPSWHRFTTPGSRPQAPSERRIAPSTTAPSGVSTLQLVEGSIPDWRPRSDACLTEGRLLARVRHPNVITVYGAEVHDGRVGLWMELIAAQTLEQMLPAHGPLSAREAALVGIDLCRALAAVHARRAHPSRRQGAERHARRRRPHRPHGLRHRRRDLSARERAPGAGTPLYLAPELFAGQSRHVAKRHLQPRRPALLSRDRKLSGEGTTMEQLRQAHSNRQQRMLRDLRPDAPEGFIRVVEGLRRIPKVRYRTAAPSPTSSLRRWGSFMPPPAKTVERRRWPGRQAVSAYGRRRVSCC